MNRTKTHTTMKRLTQLSILLLGMFLALPLKARVVRTYHIQNAIMSFLKDKRTTIIEGSYSMTAFPSTEFPKDSAMSVKFTCKDAKPWKQLVKLFEEQWDIAEDYRIHKGPGGEATRGLRSFIGPKDKGRDVVCIFTACQNARLLIFNVKPDGLLQAFILQWDDLPTGAKKGYITQHLSYDMGIVEIKQGDDRITMDSVRTAIKVGETVKNNPKQEIDTTYIDGKWAVSARYHRDVLHQMDHFSDFYDGFYCLKRKLEALATYCKATPNPQFASIGFALKREASRYERLLTPEEFALIWKELYVMEDKAKHCDPQIQNYFKAAESILRGKVNESVRLSHHDTKRHQFLRDNGFTVTRNDNGRWYYAVSGKHYTGNKELEYLDACADEDSVLRYTAEHKETNLKPGIYKLTAAARTSYQGNTGAFIFAKAADLLLSEIPACDDRGGDIWRDAAIRVKEADEKGQQISPNDVRIALANGGMGYGWNKVVIDGIEVRDGKLTYGVSCDPDFTGHPFKGCWLSAVDFVLERVGDLPANEQQ